MGVQSEDCLHLNVFTPGLRDGKKRPVLVYFHGGAYNNGTVNSDLYDGKRLCHRGDVVVVTVNHRLNAFGYMYLGDLAPEYKDSGNAGQLDLVLALKWIKENIAEFGGDPTRVLIFGQSGGGAKCAALMATPVAKGYFNRVMTMSGQQIKGASIEIASGRTMTVLEKMGAGGLKGKELVAKLDSLTMEQIQDGARAVSSDWLPVVDNVILFRNPFRSGCSSAVGVCADDAGQRSRRDGGRTGAATVTWEQAAAALDAAVHEYLGPVKAEDAVAEFRKDSSGLHADAGGYGRGDGVSRVAGAALGGGAAGKESDQPGAHVGLPDELYRRERTGDAYDRYSFHVRQHRYGERTDWDRSAACGGCECAGGDHVGDADSVREDGEPERRAPNGLPEWPAYDLTNAGHDDVGDEAASGERSARGGTGVCGPVALSPGGNATAIGGVCLA